MRFSKRQYKKGLVPDMRDSRKINKKSSGSGGGKMRLLLKTGVFFMLLVSIYFGARYALAISKKTLFPVKEIVFSGNKHLTDSELKAMMGFRGNESLLSISGEEIKERLLKSPWIKAVSFRKDFPNRFLVRVEEASPSAIIDMKGRSFFADDQGNMLEEIKGEYIPFLPVISGNPYKNRDVFFEVMNLVKAMKTMGFVNMKDRIEVAMPNDSRPEDISMRVDGVFIKVGYGEYENKLERLMDLEDEIFRRGIPVDYIDLRFMNKVVVRPVNEVVK